MSVPYAFLTGRSGVGNVVSGGGGGTTTDIALATHRLLSGSGTTPISFGVPVLTTDAYTSVGNISLWNGGTEVACYIEALGTQASGQPCSLLVQCDQTLTYGSPGTLTLKLATAPAVSRLTKRSLGWITSGISSIHTVLPSNMQGIVLRSAADMCAWSMWPHPMKAWGSFTPTSDDSAVVARFQAVAPTMFNRIPEIFGVGTGNACIADQYSRVYTECAWGAMLADPECFRRAIQMYQYNRQTTEYWGGGGGVGGTDSDSYGPFSFLKVQEPYFTHDSGAMGWLFFGDTFGRDDMLLGQARGRFIQGDEVWGDVYRTSDGNSIWSPRMVAVSLRTVLWCDRIGFGSNSYTNNAGTTKTLHEWAQTFTQGVMDHPAWQTMGTGKQFRENGGSAPLYLDPYSTSFKTALICDGLLQAARLISGVDATAVQTRIRDVMDYLDTQVIPPSSPTLTYIRYITNPSDTQIAVDQNGNFAHLWRWDGRATVATALFSTAQATANDGAAGPFVAGNGFSSSYKTFNETFHRLPHYFGYKYGG